MRAVVDSTVLIALARAKLLELLKELFTEVVAPPAVWAEATEEGKEGSREILASEFIRVVEVRDRSLIPLLARLDEGEAEAILLARELKADVVVLDDRDSRAAAKLLGLRVVGTAGLLVLAKRRGLIKEVRPVLELMRRKGFYLSDKVVREVLAEAGEL